MCVFIYRHIARGHNIQIYERIAKVNNKNNVLILYTNKNTNVRCICDILYVCFVTRKHAVRMYD